MKLYVAVALCSLVTFGSATHTLESQRCAWGESYWCSDLQAAKSCDAIRHCMSTIWKNQELEEDSTEVCEFCEAIIDDVKKFVTENKTEDEISRFLISACGVIPDETIAATCKVLAQEYVPEILQMLSQDVSPQVVCSLLKLCHGVEDKKMHNEIMSRLGLARVNLHKTATPIKGSDTQICTDCKKFFTDIKGMITSKALEDQIKKMIEQEVCAQLGTLKQECDQLVEQYIPLVMQMIAQYYDPNMICRSFGFCNATVSDQVRRVAAEMSQLLKNPRSTEECTVCKSIFGELQALARDATIQGDVENFLKTEVCGNLGAFKQQCVEYVDRFGPSVFQLIATLLDPNMRCQQLGFCPGNLGNNDVIRLAEPEVSESKSHDVAVSAECAICEFIMQELESLISKNSTEKEIIAALDKVCEMLPSTLSKSCEDFVNTYGPAIVALLIQELDPAQVCTTLGLCSQSALTAPAPPLRNDDVCIMCETIVQYVEALLDENATVAEVEAVMKKVCNFLPDTMKTQYTQIVDKYGPLIVHLITTAFTPQQVCQLAKLCDGGAANKMPIMSLSPAQSVMSGASQCSYGPTYWCASQRNAVQCGAVDHCKNYVWKKN